MYLRLFRLILTYLIPCHLLTTHTLPSAQLLEPFPRLRKLFLPLAAAIRNADLRAFDIALRDAEDELIRRRIFLTLERGRDIALRNLLRKVFIAGGFEEGKEGAAPVRRSRIPVTEFVAAMKISSGEDIDADEVECLIANMIYKVRIIFFFRYVSGPALDRLHEYTRRTMVTEFRCVSLVSQVLQEFISYLRLDAKTYCPLIGDTCIQPEV